MRGRDVVAVTAVGLAASGVAGVTAWRRVRRLGAVPRPEIDLPGEPVRVTSADGTRLAALVVRPERPRAAVVLSHGWAMGTRFWHHQIRALADDDVLVVAYDQRGHGDSERAATGDYGSTVLAIDLDTVVHELVPDDLPLAVVGHSMGAMSVVAWATHPAARALDRLRGAVLFNTGVHQLVPSAASMLPRAMPEGLVTQLLSSPLPVPRSRHPLVRELVRYVAHGPDAHSDAVALTEELFLSCPAEVRAGFGGTLARLDLRHTVGRLTAPCLVVGGEHDRMTPVEHARDLVADLPAGELVELPRAGHQAPLELPEATTALITRHLAAVC